MRALLSLGVAVAVGSVALPASANGGGVAGYTGKPNVTAPQGQSCNQCHSGGTAPQVRVEGPATLAAGQQAEYSLVVQTGQTRAAGAVAATDGVMLTPVSGLRDSFGEMVQNASLATANGQATFRFRVTAPTTGSSIRLWAVGLAASGAGTGGDRAAHATRDITITGGAPPPADAGSGSGGGEPPPAGGGEEDAGAAAPSSSGGAPTTGGLDPDDEAAPGEADDDDDDDDDVDTSGSGRRLRSSGPEAASCSAAPGSGAGGAAVTCLVLVAAALASRRRAS